MNFLKLPNSFHVKHKDKKKKRRNTQTLTKHLHGGTFKNRNGSQNFNLESLKFKVIDDT